MTAWANQPAGSTRPSGLTGRYPRGGEWESVLDQIEEISDPIMCAVRRSAVQSIATATFTNIIFDTEDLDRYAMFAASSDTITFTVAGLYRVELNVILAANATGTNGVIQRVNGVTDFGASTSPGDATIRALCSVSYYQAAVGDTMVQIFRQTSGGNLNVTARLLVQQIR